LRGKVGHGGAFDKRSVTKVSSIILDFGCFIEVPVDHSFQIVYTVSSTADCHVVEVILAFAWNIMFAAG
jgi:hypothetical protein